MFDLSRQQAAVKKAFQRVAKVTNTEADPDLRIYNQLQPQDFTKLMTKYGEQGVIDYIKAMESKRIMGGK